MRFQVREHKALMAEIEKKDLDTSRFDFVKKSGLVSVKYPNHKRDFTFYWKTETTLNAENQWEKKVTYYFDKPSKNGISTDWDGVLFAFEIWLSSLS